LEKKERRNKKECCFIKKKKTKLGVGVDNALSLPVFYPVRCVHASQSSWREQCLGFDCAVDL
jgi:hypothetical protein